MSVIGRPEDPASASPLARRMAWETRHPDLTTRAPSRRDQREGWDVVRRGTTQRVHGPYPSCEEMLAAPDGRTEGRS
jgi:hypothetical protein